MKTQVNNPFQRWQLSPRHQDPRTRGRRARRAREEGHKFRTNLFEFRRHLCEVPVPLSPARNTSGCPQPLRGPSLLALTASGASSLGEAHSFCTRTGTLGAPEPLRSLPTDWAHPGKSPAPPGGPARPRLRQGTRSRPSHMALPPLPGAGRLLAGGGTDGQPQPERAGAATPGSPGERERGRARPGERAELPGAASGVAGAAARSLRLPGAAPSGCAPGAPGVPPLPGPPPRIAPDGLQRQRGKPPVRSVSPSGNLPAPAAQSPSHSACPESAAASGITGRSARKHKKGNLLACLLFALHLEINGIPNVATPENDDLPSPSPPFCILHRCGEA